MSGDGLDAIAARLEARAASLTKYAPPRARGDVPLMVEVAAALRAAAPILTLGWEMLDGLAIDIVDLDPLCDALRAARVALGGADPTEQPDPPEPMFYRAPGS